MSAIPQRAVAPHRRTPTLRTRLTLTSLLLAGAAILVVGVVTHETLESYLTGRVDQQLRVARLAAVVAFGTRVDLPALPAKARPAGQALLPPGTYAELRRDGEVLDRVTFRYGLQKQAPPEFGAAAVRESSATREPFTTNCPGDGSMRYRALATGLREGLTLIVAVPLTEVDATLQHTLWIEIALGVGMLTLLVVAAWLLVRRELLPLDGMAAAAGEIAAGDLTRRVEPAEPHTEVGRLGLALNAMLAQIERAFAAREASEQRMRRFLADASHELRTPLTSIRGYAELFHRGADKRPEDLAVSMRRIEEEARRMGVLVDDLLLLARLDDQRPLMREPVELTALVADCLQDARAGAPARDMSLTLRGAVAAGSPAMAPVPGAVDTAVLSVTGDDHRLRQVVANLLSNAARHTPAGTPVEVDLSGADEWAVLSVRDHGPGLSPEQAARVFEPFYRSDAGRSRQAGGAGLGLAIAKAIVDAHGGELAVEDTPGGGATFVVRLPLRAEGSAPRRPPASPAGAATP